MANIDQAYRLLGLEQGATLDQVRAAYKQLALRFHPDKNHGDADATTQFQRLSEAYNLVCNHVESGHDPSDYGDPDDNYPYFYSDEGPGDANRAHPEFFTFVFEDIWSGWAYRCFKRSARGQWHETALETPYEREARLRREMVEKERAEQRRAEAQHQRAQEMAARRAFEAEMRESEHQKAEARQRAKTMTKKAKAEEQRKKAAKVAQAWQQRAQTLRSAVFAAARAGNSEQVKKGIWEDSVDPAGGEVRVGCEAYANISAEDPKETLLFIAVRNGDAELVEWLDAHSADPEERNSFGLSAFHMALRNGHIAILKYFFEAYDPKDEDNEGIYALSSPNCLLSIALESAEPEVIWMILDRGLASAEDMANAWTRIATVKGKEALITRTGGDAGKYTEIENLLMCFGGFTAPPTADCTRDAPPLSNQIPSPGNVPTQRGRGRGRGRGAYNRHSGGLRGRPWHKQPSTHGKPVSLQEPQSSSGRGSQRGRGRGHGHGRGRGRGRGRDHSRSRGNQIDATA